MKKEIVAVRSCDDYEYQQVYDAVWCTLNDIGFTVPREKRILLKPNTLAQYTPDQGATTHPVIVDALCRIFTEHGCSVTIGDSSAFYQSGGTRRALETTGMAHVARTYGASLLPFEDAPLHKITGCAVLDPLWITGAVFDHDLVVNIPKLKVHNLARYSGAIKNIYGCIPGATKQRYHEQFQTRPDYREFWGGAVVDAYQTVAPGLTVMDAVYGLDKNGPAANGTPVRVGVILASTNGAALDVIACRMIGFDPHWVPAVRVALERKLADADNIAVIGHPPALHFVKLPDTLPAKPGTFNIGDYLFHQVIMKPQIKKSACSRCTACAEICSAGAITCDPLGLPQIDYHKCIRCYCCSEQCQKKAIPLKGSMVNHLIRAMRRVMKI